MDHTKRVIALGFFDGLHLGHQRLLDITLEMARSNGWIPAVLSFDTHPDKMVSGSAAGLITSVMDRRELLQRLFGIDEMILLHFDNALMHMDWADFVQWLCRTYHVACLVAGYDFRFGYRGLGDAEKLQEKCRQMGVQCQVAEKVTLDGITVSSTHIRALLEAGKLTEVNRFLGHPYSLSDVVQSGRHVGRAIGRPTVNMTYAPQVLVPRHGVYATVAHTPHGAYPAVTNIGVRPTFQGDGHLTVESNLLGFSGDLYGQRLRLDFYAFLRAEQKFPDAHALTRQIRADVDAALDILKSSGAIFQADGLQALCHVTTNPLPQMSAVGNNGENNG